MPEAVSDKPVFIDQMPDYQQALKQIAILSQDQDKFIEVADKLGLGSELTKETIKEGTFAARGRELIETQKNMDIRVEKTADTLLRPDRVVGVVSVVGSSIVGYAAGKRWGAFKGALTGLAVAAGALGVWALSFPKVLKTGILQKISGNHDAGLAKDYDTLRTQQEQWQQQFADMQQQFAAQMATAMLDQRKMLVGEGADMKLVSTAEPAVDLQPPAPQGMAAKYAVPPSVTHAESAALSQTSAAQQR